LKLGLPHVSFHKGLFVVVKVRGGISVVSSGGGEEDLENE